MWIRHPFMAGSYCILHGSICDLFLLLQTASPWVSASTWLFRMYVSQSQVWRGSLSVLIDAAKLPSRRGCANLHPYTDGAKGPSPHVTSETALHSLGFYRSHRWKLVSVALICNSLMSLVVFLYSQEPLAHLSLFIHLPFRNSTYFRKLHPSPVT